MSPTSATERRLLLVLDGNSLAYRAFFAVPDTMATSSGQVTNAVYGFANMLVSLLKDHRPTGLAVAFDRPEPTFRHDAEPTYKAQRESAPDVLRQQMGIVRELLVAAGVPVLEVAGFEADDVIATTADRAVDDGWTVVVVTGDRDSFQLVRDPDVRVLYNKRGVSDVEMYDEAGIIGRTGVTSAQYPMYAALRGDPSDNLPGVPGVGEKTAAKLISQYGGLDGIYEHLDELTPKLRESLAASEERARKNVDLMTLRHDAPIDVHPDDLHLTPNGPELRRICEFLEFKNMFPRFAAAFGALGVDLDGGVDSTEVVEVVRGTEVSTDHLICSDADAVAELAATLVESEVFDVAPAWSGDPGRSSLRGLAVATPTTAHWVEAGLLGGLSDVLAGHPFRALDAKPLLRTLLASGIDARGLVLDVAIAAYLLDPSSARYGLSDIVDRHGDVRLPVRRVPEGQLDLSGAGDDDDVRMAVVEARAVGMVAPVLRAKLASEGMADLYDDIENPLVRVLARMEHVGIAVDSDALRNIARRLTDEVESLAAALKSLAGSAFNPNSPAQLSKILFEERGLTPPKKTKTGFSTDAATLEKLRDEWPEFIDPLLRYREVEKLRGTYGEGLLEAVASDARIHATFNQTVARTGRLSSDQPNLHNIPVRTEEGRVFRTAFVPRPGCSLLVADYNQIELRCIAHLADDPGLIAAFTSGQDVHRATAARVFGVDPSAVDMEQRSKAKMVSYGLAYGMEAYGLAQRLAIPVGEAQEILDAYFVAFPNVRSYMDATVDEARRKGYTETVFGRRRPIPELASSNFRLKQAGERQAMNAGIQGLAADIFKIALVRIDAALEDDGRASRLVLQVHDEVVVEVPEDERDVVGPLVIGIMENAAELRVPLAVNVAWGSTWADAKA